MINYKLEAKKKTSSKNSIKNCLDLKIEINSAFNCHESTFLFLNQSNSYSLHLKSHSSFKLHKLDYSTLFLNSEFNAFSIFLFILKTFTYYYYLSLPPRRNLAVICHKCPKINFSMNVEQLIAGFSIIHFIS